MTDNKHYESNLSPSVQWSLYAGFYMFVCATATAFVLYDLLSLLADVIGLPAQYAMIVLASPALLIGAVTWWAIVERHSSYTYLLGGAFGLVTALLTGLLWTARFVSVWGFEMLAVPIVGVFVLLVFGLVSIAGILTGLPLMYGRRHLGGPSDKNEEPV